MFLDGSAARTSECHLLVVAFGLMARATSMCFDQIFVWSKNGHGTISSDFVSLIPQGQRDKTGPATAFEMALKGPERLHGSFRAGLSKGLLGGRQPLGPGSRPGPIGPHGPHMTGPTIPWSYGPMGPKMCFFHDLKRPYMSLHRSYMSSINFGCGLNRICVQPISGMTTLE